MIDAHPELVRWLDVDGDNPDIDTTDDLARVAELAWADRVRRNREQVDRFRELPDGADFYASVSSIFREDPDRVGDPVLEALRRHAQPDDTWLDIGAGAGRYALPMARSVREVVALDPSAVDARRAPRGDGRALDRQHPGHRRSMAGREHRRGLTPRRHAAGRCEPHRPRRLRRRGDRSLRRCDGARDTPQSASPC